VRPFDVGEGLEQLRAEMEGAGLSHSDGALRELVTALGGLPLAIHLAAGHLRLGMEPQAFITILRDKKLNLRPTDPADRVETLHESLNRSYNALGELLLERADPLAGATVDRLMRGFLALGFAPLSGFTARRGADFAGMDRADFAELLTLAEKLALVDRAAAPDGAALWRIHPILAEWMRARAGPPPPLAIAIVGDPRLLTDTEYGELIRLLGDLVRAHGGLGVERVYSAPIDLGVPAGAPA
jgi:hypothetical protein